MDLSNFREEYLKGQLHRKDLAENPFEQFQTWFEQALKADIPEPNAFSLATADAQGRPSLRTVLLKYFDRKGFVFFTNYGSHKARDIEENPQVCMMLPWVMLERQIIIYGKAVKVSRAESLKYFLTRPKESQLGAWVSHQSSVISGRKLLEMKLMELKNKFSKGEIPLPSFWGGYRIIPDTFEFWHRAVLPRYQPVPGFPSSRGGSLPCVPGTTEYSAFGSDIPAPLPFPELSAVLSA